jgi:hypothetical protein
VDYLIEFGQRDDVRGLASRYLSLRSTHAIDLGLDERWLLAWRWRAHLEGSNGKMLWRHLEEWCSLPPWLRARWAGWLAFEDEFVAYPFGIDPNWRPPFSGELAEQWERYGPFVATVILRPVAVEEERGELAEVAGVEGLRVTFEPQPVPRLLAGPTSVVRPLIGGLGLAGAGGLPGTLGGVVEAASGSRLAVTCAHVLDEGVEVLQPASADNPGAAARIGICGHRSPLNAHNPPVDAYDPDLNEVDAALVQLDEGVGAELAMRGIGPLTGISMRSDLHEHCSVEIVGLRAKRRPLRVGKLRLVGEFSYGHDTYGYQNLFELRRRSRHYGVTGELNPPVSGGDSGAWVVRPGAGGPEWAGVVVAGEGPTAYAVMAASVVEWMERETPLGSIAVC